MYFQSRDIRYVSNLFSSLDKSLSRVIVFCYFIVANFNSLIVEFTYYNQFLLSCTPQSTVGQRLHKIFIFGDDYLIHNFLFKINKIFKSNEYEIENCQESAKLKALKMTMCLN